MKLHFTPTLEPLCPGQVRQGPLATLAVEKTEAQRALALVQGHTLREAEPGLTLRPHSPTLHS